MKLLQILHCSTVLLLLLIVAFPAHCMLMKMDLSTGSELNDDLRKNLLIITGVTRPVAKLAPGKRTASHEYPTARTIVVDRVLLGAKIIKGAKVHFIVPSGGEDGNVDGRLVDGKPVLLILRRTEQHWVFGSGIFFVLGPVDNCMLSLKSLHDPQINLVQQMVDVVSAPTSTTRWERAQALLPTAQHNPMLLEFLLNTQDNLFRAEQEDLTTLVKTMLARTDEYTPASFVYVDQLLTGNDIPGNDFAWRDEVWTNSPARKKLFSWLAANAKQDDPDRAYIDYVRQTLAGDQIEWKRVQAVFPRDISELLDSSVRTPAPRMNSIYSPPIRDSFRGDVFIAIVKSPGIDSGIHEMNILAMVYDQPQWQWLNVPRQIMVQQALPAGIYFLGIKGINNGTSPSYGYENSLLIAVGEPLLIASADNPDINDVQPLLKLIGQPQSIRRQQTFDIDLYQRAKGEMKHPLLLNFYLLSKAKLLKELAAASDTTLQQILQHPQQYTPHTVALADRLFTGKQSQNWAYTQFDWLSPAARVWKTSPQRKALLEGLLKKLKPKDTKTPNNIDHLIRESLQQDFGEK